VPIYTQNGNGELPPYVKELLANWPASGTGNREVHRHILAVANGLRHHVELEHAAALIRSSMPRAPKGRLLCLFAATIWLVGSSSKHCGLN
jgi:hypothetical protein